jgi:hypothetical protein
MSIFHYYDLEYCEAFVFDEFLISQIRESTIIRPSHSIELANVITKHVGDSPMVYISNRILSYTVDPITYLDTAKIDNLKAIAIVTQERKFKKSAEYEKIFYKKSFEVFTALSQAIGWAKLTLHEFKNDK